MHRKSKPTIAQIRGCYFLWRIVAEAMEGFDSTKRSYWRLEMAVKGWTWKHIRKSGENLCILHIRKSDEHFCLVPSGSHLCFVYGCFDLVQNWIINQTYLWLFVVVTVCSNYYTLTYTLFLSPFSYKVRHIHYALRLPESTALHPIIDILNIYTEPNLHQGVL